MPQTLEMTAYAQRLILEYNRARKLLRKYFKKRHNPDEARAKIKVMLLYRRLLLPPL
jgi:molybdenum-dependent DNA-binding transcriptional regulator ModE